MSEPIESTATEHVPDLAAPRSRDGEMAAMWDLANRFLRYRDAAESLIEVCEISKRDELMTQRHLWTAAAELTEQAIRDNS